jgi:hypothetical protein
MFTSTSCEIDPRSIEEFSRALDEYADYRHSKAGGSKGYDYALNRVAKDVAFKAGEYLIRADKAMLKTILSDPAVASRLLSARFARAGKKRPGGADWKALVAYFVSHTPQTASFMASGWLPAARKLMGLVKEGSGVSVSRAFGRSDDQIPTKNSYPSQMGGCVPAHDVGEGLVVEIFNSSVNPRNPTSWSEGLGKHGAAALERALDVKALDMMRYLESEQEARGRKFNKEG